MHASEHTLDSSASPAAAPQGADALLPLIYEQLRQLAAKKMSLESPGQTLQATALVHEAWLRLNAHGQAQFQNRTHFLAAAAEAMRHILVDQARRKKAARHGGGWLKLDLESLELPAGMDEDRLLDVHEALEKLAAHDAPKAELVKLRFFGGLSLEEAAQVQGISTPTAKRHWAYARAWLYREMSRSKE